MEELEKLIKKKSEAYDAKARELELIGAEIRALNEVKAALVQASAISDGYAEIHRSAAKRVP